MLLLFKAEINESGIGKIKRFSKDLTFKTYIVEMINNNIIN
jgi:hypothetical protein